MSDIDVAALRVAAEGATPGPWVAEGDQVAQAFDDGMVVGGIVHASWEQQDRHDVAYIAAANPAVVLELLDRLERLEAACITIPAEQFKRLTADDEEQP